MSKNNHVENTERVERENPAALLAEAMLLGSGAAAIEAMEARGQRQLLQSDVLPVDMSPSQEAFEALGFVFGQPVDGDPLFVSAALPNGWSRRASDHSMWSYIDDETGAERVSVFYKAASYDRRAFMRMEGGR